MQDENALILEDQNSTLRLSGEAKISQAALLYAKLVQTLNQAEAITIDCSQIQACDASFIQLLCACHKECVKRQKQFKLIGCSPAVQDTFVLCGIVKTRACDVCPEGKCLLIPE